MHLDRPNRRARSGCVLAFAFTLLLAASSSGGTVKGLWLLPRKDCRNTARADVVGAMKTAPREVWSYGTPANDYGFLKPVTIHGKQAFFAQVRHGVRLVRPDGTLVWKQPTLGITSIAAVTDFGGTGKPVALALSGTETLLLLDVTSGKTLWKWSVPTGAYLGGYRLLDRGKTARLIVFPQNTMLGSCYELSAAQPVPRLLWTKDYTGRYWQNYGPFFVLADMDNDRREEIVLVGKPGYMGVIDLDTGEVRFGLKYEITDGPDIGRPYGLICATDVDGDGYRDAVVVSCQVEHYISVLKNNAGKSFSLAWSRYVGNDLPTGDKELRPSPESLVDVNGDGKQELVIGAFNMDGDNRWHTIVFDTLAGNRLADLPDRYFWGCWDLTGDGRPEIITSSEKGRRAAMPAAIQAVDGKTFRNTAELDKAAFVFVNSRLPDDTGFHAVRNTPFSLAMPDHRELVVNRNGKETAWCIAGGTPHFAPFGVSSATRAVMLSEGTGKLPKADLKLKGVGAKGAPSASWPLVSTANGKRELIMSLSDGRIIGGMPDLGKQGRLRDSWTVRGAFPSVWIGSDGRRLVCAMGSGDRDVFVYEPSAGQSPKPTVTIETSMPVLKPYGTRSTGELMPFGDKEMRLFVGLRPGVHNLASAVYDGSGKLLWSDPLNGPYPRIPASADLNGDGIDEVFVDNHGKDLIYDAKGNGRVIAQGWSNSIPGRSDGAKYAVPIIGPFGPDGAGRIVLSPGLDCLEVLDFTGARLAKQDYASTYIFEWCGSAIARAADGAWNVGMVDKSGMFHCADANTCRTRWTLDLGCKATSPINMSSGDVNGDGSDDYLVGLPDGRLLALTEKEGKGLVMWKVTFDAGANEAFLADVDGDGRGEIVVELDDGRVKVLR